MKKNVTTIIDETQCTGCGLCVPVCPCDTIALVDGKARIVGDQSMGCGHCAAACPVGAITVPAAGETVRLRHVRTSERWQAPGSLDAGSLVDLMRSRRSCRNYRDTPVPRSVLEDLVSIGTTAPSGTNCQMWSFTVLDSREKVVWLGARVSDHFKKLNRLAASGPIRLATRLFAGNELELYYRRYFHTIADGIRRWEENGEDLLFHGATAAVIVAAGQAASCPAEDALLATQNMLLGAHALGLGTCLIGFAVAALQRNRGLRRQLGIPEQERVYAVMATGYPDERYVRPATRRKIVPRYPAI